MSRNGAGVYSLPGTYEATPGETILASQHNDPLEDLQQDANTPRPVVAGGTGESVARLPDTWYFYDPADDTKRARLDAGNVTANQTRVLTAADRDIDLAKLVSSEYAQSLSDTEQAQARANIGAASLLDVRRNRIVNPCMQVSQENGDNAGTTTGYHAADQWRSQHTSDGAISFQRVAAVTPAGAHYRLRVSVTTADTALSAGQFLSIQQRLEASRMRDFLFGSANARPGVLRVGIKAPAGTYGLAIFNAANNRCFIAEVVVAAGEANTDVIKEIAFAGDTTGTWETGDVYGWSLNITFASGSTYQGTVGWQAGGYLTTANQTNGLASTANVFEIFDVGLRLDPDGTGVYGQFEVPEYGQVLRDCQRYYQLVGVLYSDPYNSGATRYFPALLYTTQRTTASWSSGASLESSSNVSSISYQAFVDGARVIIVPSTSSSVFTHFIAIANARM